jgi:hypothetical protein
MSRMIAVWMLLATFRRKIRFLVRPDHRPAVSKNDESPGGLIAGHSSS